MCTHTNTQICLRFPLPEGMPVLRTLSSSNSSLTCNAQISPDTKGVSAVVKQVSICLPMTTEHWRLIQRTHGKSSHHFTSLNVLEKELNTRRNNNRSTFPPTLSVITFFMHALYIILSQGHSFNFNWISFQFKYFKMLTLFYLEILQIN